VTEELRAVPSSLQIGQTGQSVNPIILLAIGISGAPQHLNYIGQGATILAFNRDPEAPLMTLNERQPRPRVFPIVGDLFQTIPAFMAALREHVDVQDPNARGEPAMSR
jgi:electron transfer flavoprotein alpha subunit